MTQYIDTVTDELTNLPVPGAEVYIYDDNNNLATLYDADGNEIDNPLTTNEQGEYSFYSPVTELTAVVYYSSRLRRRLRLLVGGGYSVLALASAQASLAGSGALAAANTGAGLADTSIGQTFWIDNGDGTGTTYRHDAGPVATEIGKFIIDPTDEGAANLIGMPQGKVGEAIKFVTPEMHGASALIANNAAALESAAADAVARGVELVSSAVYPTTATVNLPDGLVMRGLGMMQSGISSTATPAVVCGKGVSLSDMKIETTNAGRVVLWTLDTDAPSIDRCFLNGRIYSRNALNEEHSGPKISRCVVTCDFGSDYDGVQQYDVFSIYGLFGASITDCDILTNNVHRLCKVTDISTVTDPAQEVTAYNSRAFIFSRNRVRGVGGKQVFDLYSGTSGANISDNHFELSDDLTDSGHRWEVVIENKSAANARDGYDIGSALVVHGNTGYIGRCPFVRLQGSYGITQSGFTGTRRNTVKLTCNDIRRTVDNADPMVDIRFFNEVFSNGNSWEIPSGTANRSVAGYYSNENVIVGSGDVYSGGCVEVASQTANAAGLTFTGALGTFTMGGTVRNFDAKGAVRLFLIVSAENICIDGLKSRPKSSPTQLCRAVHCESNTAITQLDIVNCNATHPSGSSVAPVLDTAATAAYGVIRDNNWQPRFRGYVTSLPGSGNYLRGDTLRQISPSIGSPVEWTCHTSGSPGGWRVSAYIMGRGTTAQRPTLTANDSGVQYEDTTLNAGGQLIRWNGTNWKDVAGTTV
ncbi:hypothetical protein L7H23_01260 [Sphingopyxis sp. BSN-002]|uniref:hypothetical protein n=1 Tax=Sphingopyxis sp. BSN-002 TaxID=2911495 RepID=UPI001ED9F9BC|nr:hypothetical protein [Sphingopyxis sp. BSN-002]QVJ07693.1 hypothetical protein [Sphingopyxis phage VSN-002]UKK84761.1 hypothetical protein L7H23_01260 [Sphingopyxis sp. BSN-002]